MVATQQQVFQNCNTRERATEMAIRCFSYLVLMLALTVTANAYVHVSSKSALLPLFYYSDCELELIKLFGKIIFVVCVCVCGGNIAEMRVHVLRSNR